MPRGMTTRCCTWRIGRKKEGSKTRNLKRGCPVKREQKGVCGTGGETAKEREKRGRSQGDRPHFRSIREEDE